MCSTSQDAKIVNMVIVTRGRTVFHNQIAILNPGNQLRVPLDPFLYRVCIRACRVCGLQIPFVVPFTIVKGLGYFCKD